MHHLPIMLTSARSPALMWLLPAPEELLAAMSISFPHGVQLSGIRPVALSAAPCLHGHVAHGRATPQKQQNRIAGHSPGLCYCVTVSTLHYLVQIKMTANN